MSQLIICEVLCPEFKSIKVMDEETGGFKMANILPALNLNVVPEPETSHPKWNDWQLAVDDSGYRSAAMKGTLLANWGDGPFGSGANRSTLGDAAEILMEKAPGSYRESLASKHAFDQGDGSDGHLTAEEWVQICSAKIPRALII